MNQVTVYDEKKEKWVTGFVANIKLHEYTFILVDEQGNKIGKFDYSLIKHLYNGETE